MFGSFKRFFTKSAPKRQDFPGSEPALSLPGDLSTTASQAQEDPAGQEGTASSESSDSVTLPFGLILRHVPKELQGKAGASSASGSFTLSKSQILEQLGQGSVKVPFGSLRQVAPVGVFIGNSNHDTQLVDLPLAEIMRQIEPGAFVKRLSRKKLEVPDEIANLFGQKGEPLAEVRVMEKREASAPSAPGSNPRPAPAPARVAAPPVV